MNYEDLRHILQEQTKGCYSVISTVVNGMNNEEYDGIPIIEVSEQELEFIKNYAVCDIPLRENEKLSNKKPYYDLYYVAPTLFKVKNLNKDAK